MTISLMHKSVHSSAIFLIIFPLCFFIAGGLAAAMASVMFFNANTLIRLVRHRGSISSPSTSQSHAEDRVELCVNLKEPFVPYIHCFCFPFLLLCLPARGVLGQLFSMPRCA